MQHTLTLPSYLLQHKAGIQKGLAGEKGTRWNLDTWKNHFSGDSIISNDLDAIYKKSPNNITRDDVISWTPIKNPGNDEPTYLRRLFLASMIWGWGNRVRGIKHVQLSITQANYGQIITNSFNMIKSGNIKQAYKKFSLPGCGPAFFTKFFYFIGRSYDVKPLPVILDTNVAKCLDIICAQEGWNLGEFAKVDRDNGHGISNIKPYADGYVNYVNSMDSWAKQLGCRADYIEYFMYFDRGNDIGKKGAGTKMSEGNERLMLEVSLSPEQMNELESLAKSCEIEPAILGTIWIIDHLHLIYGEPAPATTPSSEMNAKAPATTPSSEMNAKAPANTDKMKQIIHQQFSNKVFTREQLRGEVNKKYPKIPDNQISPHDWSVNTLSGKRNKNAYLIWVEHGQYRMLDSNHNGYTFTNGEWHQAVLD